MSNALNSFLSNYACILNNIALPFVFACLVISYSMNPLFGIFYLEFNTMNNN